MTSPIGVPAGGAVTLQLAGDLPRGQLPHLPRGRRLEQLVVDRHLCDTELGHPAGQQLRQPGLDDRHHRWRRAAAAAAPTPGLRAPPSRPAGRRRSPRMPTSCLGSRTRTSSRHWRPWGSPWSAPTLPRPTPTRPLSQFGIGATYTGASYPAGPDLPRGDRPGRTAPPDQHLLQRLHRGPGGRRVQHPVPVDGRRRNLHQLLHDHLPDHAGDLCRHRQPGRLGNVPEHAQQRPPAQLCPPDQPDGRAARLHAERRHHVHPTGHHPGHRGHDRRRAAVLGARPAAQRVPRVLQLRHPLRAAHPGCDRGHPG